MSNVRLDPNLPIVWFEDDLLDWLLTGCMCLQLYRHVGNACVHPPDSWASFHSAQPGYGRLSPNDVWLSEFMDVPPLMTLG
jgi:hypothetical protein